MTRRRCQLLIPLVLLLTTFSIPPREPQDDTAGLARAQRWIAEREYWASAGQGGVLQAPNRAHDLRTWFDETGIRVHDRTAGGSPELLRLSLEGFGRGDALRAPEPADEVVAEEARVEIRREGLIEWYVNSETGLEQGFTLAERPRGKGSLVLELTVTGARGTLLDEAVVFETGAGRKLRYGELVAVDAAERRLPARLELANAKRVRIAVDDTGARYPVVIDPLLTATADTQIESNEIAGDLGRSVAGAGDVNGDGFADVIIGAPGFDAGDEDEGAAFIFHGSAAGIASGGVAGAVTQLESNSAFIGFANAVAGAGDVNGDGYSDVIVGSASYDTGQGFGEGAAFVFLGGASGIADGNPSTAAAQLESNQAPTGSGTSFGASVASAGDVNGDGYADVIVGAPYYDAGPVDEGAAFVFLGGASGIADGNPATAATQLESDQGGAEFGASVASAGDVNGDGYADVIVGSTLFDAPQVNEGAAFVFHGSASGIPDSNAGAAATQLEADLSPGRLGASVASAGDVNGDGYSDVIVGAPFYTAGENGEGAAFLFHGSASGIADGNPATAATQLESDQIGAQLGISVASAGDTNGDGYADVFVGVHQYDAGHNNEGIALLFLGGAGGIPDGGLATAAAQLESNQASAQLGASVASAGDVNGDGYADVIAGASFFGNGQAQEGAAFVYLGGGSGIESGDLLTDAARVSQIETNQLAQYQIFPIPMMLEVAGAGDVNADGFADVIIGAPLYDRGEMNEGAAFVFLGSATGIADGGVEGASAKLESNQLGAALGYSVAAAGDVDGDGYGDVIVGAPGYSNGETFEGAAFIFLGSAAGIASGNPATAATQLESNQEIPSTGTYFATTVASAGDVNGDGYGDVIVGAPYYDAGTPTEGAAFVFLGGVGGIPDGSPANAGAQLESDQAGSRFGGSVDSAGDVNGDGYADVIVGARFYGSEGAAFVFHGGPSGIADGSPATGDTQLESDQGSSAFGHDVARAGDVNGDGYADVIVGALAYDAGQADEGAAFVFHGSASGIADGNAGTAATQLESNQLQAEFGHDVASAGDVDGDGYADVVVGASYGPTHGVGEGSAYVFLGSASGVADGNPSTAATSLAGAQTIALLGAAVAGAGDVNGDGFADVIAAAARFTAIEPQEGAAFIFYGNRGIGGRRVQARQAQPGGGPAIEPWGGAGGTSFEASLVATHPEGRGRVRLESESCPPGIPFGDVSCNTQLSAGWTDVTASSGGVTLTNTIGGLDYLDLNLRWRARVLYAPFSVTQSGITAPPNPAHGPWRRHTAQGIEADVRTIPEPGALLSLASGIGLLAGLARRRSTRR